MVRHCMLRERVGSMHTRKRCVCASLVQNAVCTCCALCRSVKKGLCEVTSKKIDIRHRQGSTSMKRFAGLSLVPTSQFVVRMPQLFAYPLSAFSVF